MALALAALPLSAWAASSTSFILDPSDNVQSVHNKATSVTTGMLLDGSIDPIVGKSTSSSFSNESGDAFSYYCGDGFVDPGESCDGANVNGSTCAAQGFSSGTLSCSSTCTFVTSGCNAGGGGGGGGGGGSSSAVPTAPEVDVSLKDLAFSYGSTLLLFGTNGSTATSVKVNNSTEGVTLPTATSWKKTVALSFKSNKFSILASNGSGDSAVTSYEIYRRLIGDLTQDNKVNDYDLSKLVRLWGGTSRNADFNMDGKVNDYDFSMMVARWGTSV